jgi:hypothetical protein
MCFGHLLCPSSGAFNCTFGIGKFHQAFDDRFQAESGCSILTAWIQSSEHLMKLTNAEFTIESF